MFTLIQIYLEAFDFICNLVLKLEVEELLNHLHKLSRHLYRPVKVDTNGPAGVRLIRDESLNIHNENQYPVIARQVPGRMYNLE